MLWLRITMMKSLFFGKIKNLKISEVKDYFQIIDLNQKLDMISRTDNLLKFQI